MLVRGIALTAIVGFGTLVGVTVVLPQPASDDPSARAELPAAAAMVSGSPAGTRLPEVEQQEKHPRIAGLERQIAGREQQPAEQVFRNIEVFEGRPAISVLRVMEMAFVPNLGVDCDYCHDEGAWESDAKPPKAIARGMWALREEVQEEVRTITGRDDAVVTCYTCHKGQPKPAFAPGK